MAVPIRVCVNHASYQPPGRGADTPRRHPNVGLTPLVADLDASTRWYAEKLGMTVVMHPPKQDKNSVTVLEGGGLTVELLQRDDAMPLTTAAPSITENQQIHGFFKAGVIVEDFDKTVATLRARGVTIVIGPFPASETQRANIIVRDNAGNLIQIFGPSFTRAR